MNKAGFAATASLIAFMAGCNGCSDTVYTVDIKDRENPGEGVAFRVGKKNIWEDKPSGQVEVFGGVSKEKGLVFGNDTGRGGRSKPRSSDEVWGDAPPPSGSRRGVFSGERDFIPPQGDAPNSSPPVPSWNEPSRKTAAPSRNTFGGSFDAFLEQQGLLSGSDNRQPFGGDPLKTPVQREATPRQAQKCEDAQDKLTALRDRLTEVRRATSMRLGTSDGAQGDTITQAGGLKYNKLMTQAGAAKRKADIECEPFAATAEAGTSRESTKFEVAYAQYQQAEARARSALQGYRNAAAQQQKKCSDAQGQLTGIRDKQWLAQANTGSQMRENAAQRPTFGFGGFNQGGGWNQRRNFRIQQHNQRARLAGQGERQLNALEVQAKAAQRVIADACSPSQASHAQNVYTRLKEAVRGGFERQLQASAMAQHGMAADYARAGGRTFQYTELQEAARAMDAIAAGNPDAAMSVEQSIRHANVEHEQAIRRMPQAQRKNPSSEVDPDDEQERAVPRRPEREIGDYF